MEGRTVNIKWYAKHEGLLDIEPRFVPDFYLVLTGPHGLSGSSKGTSRPWLTTSVSLFDALQLVDALAKAGFKVGIATSVRKYLWDEAELWPNPRNKLLLLTKEQQSILALFD